MFAAEPKTKARELLDKVNALSIEERRNEFVVKSLKRAAERLTKGPEATAADFEVLGAVEALLRNRKGVRSAFTNALSRTQDNFITFLNYSLSLEEVGYIEESVHYARDAHILRPGDLDGIDRFVNVSALFGQFQTSFDLTHKWEKERPGERHWRSNFLEACVQLLSEVGVSQETTSSMVGMAYDIVNAKDLTLDSQSIEILSDEYDNWISYVINLRESQDITFDANLCLIEQLSKTTLGYDSKGVFSIRIGAK